MVEIADRAVVRRTPVIAAKRPQPAAASPDWRRLCAARGDRREPMARARRTRHRAERLLSARLGIGGERLGARPHRRLGARRMERCLAVVRRRGAPDRPDARDLDVARLQDPAARAGQRRSLRHAVHAAARSRHGRGCRRRIDAAGAQGRRPCADPARRHARRRRHARLSREVLRQGGMRPRLLQSHAARLPRRHARRR